MSKIPPSPEGRLSLDAIGQPLPAHEARIALPIKGRGTAQALAHRFERDERVAFDDGWGSLDQQVSQEHLPPATQVMHELAKSALSSNDSPDIPFELGLNPYRGCEHGCIYCYARPTHSYLNLSPGLDFETKLIAKMNIAQRLQEDLGKRSYRPSTIYIGTATDAYQPIERTLGLTRAVLEVLNRCKQPYYVITKSAGVERDLDWIAEAAGARRAGVSISITTLDPELCRILEPRAAAPHRRLLTVQRLAQAGVPVGVNIAPVIPFLNEPEIERIVKAAAQAGARSIHYSILRLPWELNALFQQWLEQHVPDRAARVMARVRDMREGHDYVSRFGSRMKGEGPWAELLRQRVDRAVNAAGLTRSGLKLDASQFQPPSLDGQARLF